VRFDVWGCRGSKSFIPARSRIGNYTSCYSLHDGSDLFVFDAGLGLASLSHEIHRQKRFGVVRRIYVLITHAHLDHWEGLKDADWFWERDNGLEVRIIGLDEAINAIKRGYEHPSFVDLDLLARYTVSKLEFSSFSFGDVLEIGDWKLENVALNHYSGTPEDKSVVQTSGYRLGRAGGPVICYISDHEPGRQRRTPRSSSPGSRISFSTTRTFRRWRNSASATDRRSTRRALRGACPACSSSQDTTGRCTPTSMSRRHSAA
jgi:ribonuclease BN (tRNA processing enzyme)